MNITKKQLEDFKEIYYKNFGEKLSDEKALEYGLSLLNLTKTIIK